MGFFGSHCQRAHGAIDPDAATYQDLHAREAPRIRPYTFRHTCLTRWARILDPYTLAYLAGHSDFGTTRRYVHPNLNTAREALEEHEWFNIRRALHWSARSEIRDLAAELGADSPLRVFGGLAVVGGNAANDTCGKTGKPGTALGESYDLQ